MGILGMIASLLGTSCSKYTVRVEFINAKDNSVIAVSEMKPEQLPESFAINTTLELKNGKWWVDSADPIEKSKFIKTGKLKVVLSPIVMMPPGDILFSLATISDDIGSVAGDALPSEKILALHEDDWRQVEFVSQGFTPEIQQEFADIKSVYQNESDGIGFKKVHVRKRIPSPFDNQQIALSDLEAVFQPKEKLQAVGFQRTRGTIPNSFAWKLDSKLILWGVTDNNTKILRLCLLREPQPESIPRLCRTFESFNTEQKLILVDWRKVTSIASDTAAFSDYFLRK